MAGLFYVATWTESAMFGHGDDQIRTHTTKLKTGNAHHEFATRMTIKVGGTTERFSVVNNGTLNFGILWGANLRTI